MKPDDFDVQKIIDTCQGTCTESLQSALEYHYPGMDEDELTGEDHAAIDNEIFMCEGCGWWCEISEAVEDEDNKCQDCLNDEN